MGLEVEKGTRDAREGVHFSVASSFVPRGEVFRRTPTLHKARWQRLAVVVVQVSSNYPYPTDGRRAVSLALLLRIHAISPSRRPFLPVGTFPFSSPPVTSIGVLLS